MVVGESKYNYVRVYGLTTVFQTRENGKEEFGKEGI